MLNVGYIEGTQGDVAVRVYYDATFTPVGSYQPLIDGPRGWCLDMTNVGGRNVKVTVTSPTGTQVINVGQGDPVTSGPATGRSRTAAAMASLGFVTRGDVQSFAIGE